MKYLQGNTMYRFVRLITLVLVALTSLPAGNAAEPDRKTHPLSVSGRALDPEGIPIRGTTIFLVSTNGIPELLGQTTSDEEGRYAFRELPLPIPAPASRAYFEYGSFRVLGRAPGYACAWRAMKHLLLDPRFEFDPTARSCGFYPGEDIVLDLKFEKAYPITGQVVDDRGQPIAGAKVTITGCEDFDDRRDEQQPTIGHFRSLNNGAQILPDEFVTTSAPDGRFAFQRVGPRRFCSLLVEHPDYTRGLARVATSEDPPKGERRTSLRALPVAMTLQRKYTVPVRVSWADTGRPAAGVSVLAISEPAAFSDGSGRGLVDLEGNVVLRLPKGKYRLRGLPPPDAGYVMSERDPIVDESPPERLVYFDMARGAKLTLRVVDAKGGKGVPEVSFWCREGEGERVDIGSISTPSGYRTTNEEGEIRAVVLPGTRRYGLSFGRQPDYQSTDPADVNTGRELKIAAGETATIEFQVNLQPNVEPPTDDGPMDIPNAPDAITGQVVYDGPPPPPRIIAGTIGSAGRRAPPLFDDSVLVDAETHGLANVVIYFDRVPAGVNVPVASKTRIAMSVVDGRFEPRISLMRRGQTCVLTNEDPDVTNVHINTMANPGLNQLIRPQQTITWRFDKPERIPRLIQSDIQPGMMAYQMVTDHPWVAVTDKTGKFAIRGLPPGKYQFKVWHETAGYLEKALAVEVKPGAATDLNLTYPPARFGR